MPPNTNKEWSSSLGFGLGMCLGCRADWNKPDASGKYLQVVDNETLTRLLESKGEEENKKKNKTKKVYTVNSRYVFVCSMY